MTCEQDPPANSLTSVDGAVRRSIDLNADVGELAGVANHDRQILEWVSSANIACGFHAGDRELMVRTVDLATSQRVAIGAHPGFPDRAGFGRRPMQLSWQQAYDCVLEQISTLRDLVQAVGGLLHHVKPHGAMYNQANEDTQLADAITRAIADLDQRLFLFAPPAGQLRAAGITQGLRVVAEAFCDRRYGSDGNLIPRNSPDAVWHQPPDMVAQARSLAFRGEVQTVTGTPIPLCAKSLCLHGDHPAALEVARQIHQALVIGGLEIRPPH